MISSLRIGQPFLVMILVLGPSSKTKHIGGYYLKEFHLSIDEFTLLLPAASAALNWFD